MAKLTTYKSRYWDCRAFFYALYYKLPVLSFPSRYEHKSLIDLWDSLPEKPSGIHLDIACGARPVCLSGEERLNIGLDSTFEMLRYAGKARIGWLFINANALLPALQPSTIVVITAAGLTEYLPEPFNFFKEVREVLRENGILIFTFSHYNIFNRVRKLYNPPMSLRSAEEWEGILSECGFKVIRLKKLLLQTQILCIKSKI